MATKKGEAARKTKAKSARGGARSGAGRKPKAITELREEVLAPLMPIAGRTCDALARTAAEDHAQDLAARKTAAEFALALFERTMRDEAKTLDLRLDCAREVLNRTIGKPRTAEAPARDEGGTEQVHIYMPDNGRDVAACG